MQLEAQSIALALSKQCFWRHRSLLWLLRSIAAIIVQHSCVKCAAMLRKMCRYVA